MMNTSRIFVCLSLLVFSGLSQAHPFHTEFAFAEAAGGLATLLILIAVAARIFSRSRRQQVKTVSTNELKNPKTP